MSNIEVRKVLSKKEKRVFATFGNKLYRGAEFYVPDLEFDVIDTFNPEKNPAYEFCESEQFVAYRDGVPVGRVAAIINHRANKTWNTKYVRFSYPDFVDDIEVSKALIRTVENWGRERGMTDCQGPMGFTDFDKEGLLTEGFDSMGSMFTIYNHPYYVSHLEQLGYQKEAEWIQLRMVMPEEIPERFKKMGEMVMKRYNAHITKVNSNLVYKHGYGQKIFDLLNQAYAPLFGFSELSQKQVDTYVNTYFKLIDPDFITVVENEKNELIAVAITMNSLANAMRKANGSLLPFGWFHLLRALKFKMEDTVEMMLIAVRPDYQGKGINALFFYDLIPRYIMAGFKYAETLPQLETNLKELNQWTFFNPEVTKRRRCYVKPIV